MQRGFESGNQGRSGLAQLFAVHSGKAMEGALTLRGESDIYLTAVVFGARTLHQAALFQAIDQAHGAVMPDQEVIG